MRYSSLRDARIFEAVNNESRRITDDSINDAKNTYVLDSFEILRVVFHSDARSLSYIYGKFRGSRRGINKRSNNSC